MSTKPSPLSVKLREKADEITVLLNLYTAIRYGDEEFQQSKGDSGTPPQIFVISSPRNIFEEETGEPETEHHNNPEEAESPKVAVNPLWQALNDLGEINQKTVKRFELHNRYNILLDLGVVEQYNCAVLLSWVRELAAKITYILETREIYSTEVKAIYPELLMDLEIARSTSDQLSYTLSKQNGILASKQYTTIMTKLLHYAQIAQQAALQLADHHEEYATRERSPLEAGPEIEWVFEKEPKPTPPKEEPKEK